MIIAADIRRRSVIFYWLCQRERSATDEAGIVIIRLLLSFVMSAASRRKKNNIWWWNCCFLSYICPWIEVTELWVLLSFYLEPALRVNRFDKEFFQVFMCFLYKCCFTFLWICSFIFKAAPPVKTVFLFFFPPTVWASLCTTMFESNTGPISQSTRKKVYVFPALIKKSLILRGGTTSEDLWHHS